MGKDLTNRVASLAAFVLIGVLQGFGSSNLQSVSPHNQFNFQPKGSRAEAGHKLNAAANPNLHRGGQLGASAPSNQNQTRNSAHARLARRHTANPPVGKIGFVSATQIPAGGGAYHAAFPGDFNGDGKKDVATIVQNSVSSSLTFSISVVLNNGNGTFQAPILTPIPGNDPNAQIVVGDVSGDKKDDIIVAHQNGHSGCTSSCFDVLISKGDGTFTLGTNYSITPNNLAGGTLADVNGDGKLDVVVVDQSSPAHVWTVLGNGDGTFQSPTSVALSGAAGSNVVFADFNGDGFLDLADLDFSTNQVTIYLSTSATTYASGVSPGGADRPCSMTAGDLTGDNKPEIVTANCNSDNISVYVNNGDGSFQPEFPYSGALNVAQGDVANVWPEAVTIADVNGDGKADIISSNIDSSDVTILLGNGDGTVQEPTIGYVIGGYPRSPAIVADFNGDGFADILITDNEFSLVYLKGYGDGTFRSALNYYAPIKDNQSPYSYGIATGDFNGDGIPDFVIGNCCDSTVGVTVFLSRPDGSMQTGVNYGAGGSLNYVAVADFNGDGKLDIAAADNGNGVVQIFNGLGDGTFSTGSTFATDITNSYPQGLLAGDFNHDGHPDLAVENYSQNVGILINDGTGGFLAPVNYSLSNYSYQGIGTADLKGDGNLDLVIPFNNGSAIAILLGNGDGTFQAETDLTVGLNPGSVAIADLNGDGKLDLAATTSQYGSTGVDVAFGNGDGTFQTPVFYPSSLQDFNLDNPYTTFIQAADIDGDGKLDLVYVNTEYGTVGVLFGSGNGSFYDPVEYPTSGYAWQLAVADVNQDGAPDVVTASDDFSGVTVLLNSNGSATKANYTVAAAPSTATVTAGSSAAFTFTVTPSNHYNGTVTFSCGLLPSLATCTFNPASVTLDGSTPVTVQLAVATAAVSASLQGPIHGNSTLLASLSSMGLFAMMLAGSLKKRNRWIGIVLGMLIMTMTFSLVGCGGSSSSPTPTVKAATTTTLSSSQSTAMVGQSIKFTGHVSATSGSPTGTVRFQDGSTTLGTGTVSGGVATFQTQTLAAGVHKVIAAYSGDSNFNASSSSATSQTMDRPGTPVGAYAITINATGTAGTNNGNTSAHPLNVNITVQ
ncbi:MAG TPA: FG-GAP-like repeat-containing protein [Candidatus Polarisedimenticolia bacterium]|nr:FG-GAP-like repeat-containing protein [Candidatus Polarisedimenticolia bacterium]